MPSSKYWYRAYLNPVTLPTNPISFLDPNFDSLFIRTRICNELNQFIENIEKQHGKFWISSKRGGLGKSTIIGYIARKLFLSFSKLNALPFIINFEMPYEEIQKLFYREFLKSFLRLGDTLNKVKEILHVSFPQGFEQIVVEDFTRNRERIEKLLYALPNLNVNELDIKFRKVLDACLKKWYEKDKVVTKYVLLVDEMDKLNPTDVLDFLSKSQKLFEQLYNDYGVVAFFAGHQPWVEIIHEGTEYSFFKGKIFEIQPFMNVFDVKKLIETRLVIYAFLNKQDIPFTEEAYEKIRDITEGAPREILTLTQEILNKAADQKLESVGPGFVDEISTTMFEGKIAKYIDATTYEKLRKLIDKKLLYSIANIMYDYSARHEIPKIFDDDFDARVKYLGLEISDKDWHNVIEELLKLEIIVDKETYWSLSKDLVELFGKMDKDNISRKYLPSIIHKFKLTPTTPRHIDKVDYMAAIERAFRGSGSRWLTKEEIFTWFKDTTNITLHINSQFPQADYEEKAREIFNKEFERYRRKKKKNHRIIRVQNAYRLLPEGINYKTIEFLASLKSKEIIDEYIEITTRLDTSNSIILNSIDNFLEKLLGKIAEFRDVKIKRGFIRKRTRFKVFKALRLSEELKRKIKFYIDETGDTTLFKSNIIKPVVEEVIFLLAQIIDEEVIERKNKSKISDLPQIISIDPDKQYTSLKKFENLLGKLQGDVFVLDKHLDGKGLDILLMLDEKKVNSLSILAGLGKLKEKPSLKRKFDAFSKEMERKGICTQIRILDPQDEKDIHDRFIKDSSIIINTLPLNIPNEKLANIVIIQSTDKNYKFLEKKFDKYWKRAKKLEKIQI